MRRSKAAYMNYVCPYCWNTLNKCECDLFPPYHLVLIDENIQEHIRILNKKGYHTTGCCEGHDKICISTYITFARNYFEDIDVPEGFKYNKKKRMVFYSYSTKSKRDNMRELKEKNLEILLEWCNRLPYENDSK